MLISLAMYALPSVRAATEAWADGIGDALAAHGLPRPTAVIPNDPMGVWRDPALLLTQTCGFPVTHGYRDALRPVMAPTYRAEGCGPGRYSSWIVARSGSGIADLADAEGARLAINGFDSQSGWNAVAADLSALFADRPDPPLSAILVTGAHAESLAAVRDGRADIATLDAVTATLLQREEPAWFDGVERIGFTRSAPALPYATPRGLGEADRARVRRALQAALADPALAAAREALLLQDLTPVDDADYAEIAEMAGAARPADRLARRIG